MPKFSGRKFNILEIIFDFLILIFISYSEILSNQYPFLFVVKIVSSFVLFLHSLSQPGKKEIKLI